LTELTQAPHLIETVKTQASRAALAFIFATVLFDTLGFGIIIPVLPGLVTSFVGADRARGAEIFGLFGTTWALMQFVFAPLLGALSDRYGRRPVLILSAFGLGIDYMIMALAPNLTWLFIGRVVSGITSASFTVSFAYVADTTLGEKRAGAFGMIGSIWGVGFIIGPLVGGILAGIGPRYPFWGAAALSLASAVYGLVVLPESLSLEHRSPVKLRKANPIGSLSTIRARTGLVGFVTVNFLNFLAFQVLPSVYVLYAAYRYNWGYAMVGTALALVGACNIIVQGLLVQRVVARLGERVTLLIGIVSGTAGFVIWGLAPNSLIFLLAIIFYAPIGFVQPALQGLMTRRVGPSEQGMLQGINGSLMGLTGVIGPTLFTLTFAFFIGTQAPISLPGAPFLLSAALMIASLLLALRVTRTTGKSDVPDIPSSQELGRLAPPLDDL
jgi:MFS transporter, DHA1 family, tetracycline resistance protein